MKMFKIYWNLWLRKKKTNPYLFILSTLFFELVKFVVSVIFSHEHSDFENIAFITFQDQKKQLNKCLCISYNVNLERFLIGNFKDKIDSKLNIV